MKPTCNVTTLIERFFTERLMRQRNVSANTIASYRDTFRLLFLFAQAQLRKPPSALTLTDLDATFIGAFLTDLEVKRGVRANTRNLRLTAIRSFFRFVSFEEPAHGALIQRVLAIPSKRHDKRQVRCALRDAARDRGGSRSARSNDVAWPPRSHLAAGRGSDRLAPVRADWP
ncbi:MULTISPECIES: site-specific integrase [unclassified Bradyrhizobium]|uniref:site-specific integrase n=1 Tax=unclassified Bradyrhizobium TaxID=2631580 RepID=UPI0029170235|nr:MULTISPECIES: site-specific integrase [unclassified Bradyrhizobium]